MGRVRDKMRELYGEYGTTSIISRGRRATLYVDNGEIETREPDRIEPLNTVGCGDAMTAGIAAVIAGVSPDSGPLPAGLVSRAVERGHEWARLNALQLPPGSVLPGR